MIFTPYTQPVNPAEFVGTVDLNVYAKGLANQQQMYEQNLKSLTDDFSKLFNRNAYGPDKERLKALENQLREEVGSINLSDLTDMGTASKIRNLVRSYGSDPQMQAIFKRTSIYESELEKQQKAMEKGEKWSSPALTTLNSYFNQDNFYEKPKGVNLTSGWYSYNDAKALKAAKDIVEKKKGYIEKANGEREEYEIIDPSDMLAALKTIQSSDPTYEQDMKWQFEQQYEDTDWQDYANQGNATMVQSAEATMEQARRIYNDPASTTQEKANAFENYTNAKKIADIYSDVYDTPESVEQTRENAYNDFKNRRVNRAISAVDAEQRKPAAMNEIKKMRLQQSMDISKMQQTEIFKQQAELYKYLGEEGIKKINEGKINEITPAQWNNAATKYEETKLKNARAVAEGINPDIKLKRQVPAGGLTPTWEQATEGLDNKEEDIPESRFRYHINNILENESYFRKLIKSTYSEQDIDKIIETLKKNKESYNSGVFTNDIKSSNKTMEIDPDGPGQYQIPKDVLENLVNNQYNKIYGGEDLNLDESPQEEPSTPPTDSEGENKITTPVSIPYQGDSIKYKTTGQILYWDNNTKTYKP